MASNITFSFLSLISFFSYLYVSFLPLFSCHSSLSFSKWLPLLLSHVFFPPFFFLLSSSSFIHFSLYLVFNSLSHLLPPPSNVYGSSVKESNELRSFSGGLLKENNAQQHLLPPDTTACQDSTKTKFCFKAGQSHVWALL